MSLALMARVAELERTVATLKTAHAINLGVLNDALDRLNKAESRECSCTKKKART